MNKKVVIVIMCLITLFVVGCSNNEETTGKIVLESKYYGDSKLIEIDSDLFKKISNENYILYIYNNYCNLEVPCENIFKDYMDKYKISFLSMPFEEFKNTKFYKTIKYAPSVIIVRNGDIVSYLKSDSDEDLDKYQDVDEFSKWINSYISTTK